MFTAPKKNQIFGKISDFWKNLGFFEKNWTFGLFFGILEKKNWIFGRKKIDFWNFLGFLDFFGFLERKNWTFANFLDFWKN